MKQFEFRVPKRCDLALAEKPIETACAAQGLRIAMKGHLASCPGSIHWHLKNERQKGTLEITLHPKGHRVWAQVQDGRRAKWIDVELPVLRRAIEKELRRLDSTSTRAKF